MSRRFDREAAYRIPMPSAGRLTGCWRSVAVGIGAWFVTRFALVMIGAYAFRLRGLAVPWLGMWKQWDANYYLEILTHGYQLPRITTGLESGQSDLNFFPLLPAGAFPFELVGIPPLTSGLLFANGCLVAAAIFLHRLTSLRSDEQVADWAVLSLMALPGSFALSGFMSEPLFLALSTASELAFLSGRRRASAVASGLLTVTRITGLALPAGQALDWLLARLSGRKASFRDLLLLALSPLPLTALAFYMYYLTGDGLVLMHNQQDFWQQKFEFPFVNFFLIFTNTQVRLEIQSGLGLIMLTVFVSQWRLFRPGEWLFSALCLIATSSSASASPSLLRYLMVLYPLHMAVGRSAKRSAFGRHVLMSLGFANGALMVSWAQGGDIYI